MKRWVLVLLLLVSCVAQPYVQPGMSNKTEEKIVEKVVVQCWDGSTAETTEQCPEKPKATPPTKVIVEPPAESVSVAQKYLDEARKTFTSYAFTLSDRMVIVSGDKVRHYFFRLYFMDGTPITDVYVNGKNASAYCDIEHEKTAYGDSFDYQRSKCKDYVNKPIPVKVDDWLPKGPIEYLEMFVGQTPILVEDNVQTISIGGSSKTIQPSLHYMVNSKRVILRLDKRYHVPLRVEKEGEQSVDFRDTYFDTMVLEGKPLKIDQSWFEYKPVSDYWLRKSG